MSNKSNELRSRLPALASEMGCGICHALTEIRGALRDAEHSDAPGAEMYRKALRHALIVLRPAEEGHDHFKVWLGEVLAQEPDACGLTAAERDDVLRRGRAA